ncbi:MAG: META domain-containing protein [Phycisphaeraceae bacterium]|nr:META domain-containing protein [Phycisphaeraceae bacterium]
MMHTVFPIFRGLMAVVACVGLACCASTASPKAEGGLWRLVSAADEKIDPQAAEYTIQLKDGHLSGGSGVNRYTGAYRMGKDQSLAVGPTIASTRMAGPRPLMDAEAAFLDLLTRVASYSVRDRRLILHGEDGSALLTFVSERVAR